MNLIKIDNINVPQLEVYSGMNEPQLRHYFEPEPGVFIAESPNVIRRALDAGYEPMSILCDSGLKDTDDIFERAGNIPVYQVDPDELSRINGYRLIRGILCAMRRRALPDMRDLCAGSHRVAVLEDVVNPTNVGAIMRSAAALGMDAVLLTAACSDPLYRRAARVSMGTCFQIPWTYVPDGWQDMLHEMGFLTAAMALVDDSVGIDDPAVVSADRLAVVLGTEGEGLKRETIERADFKVKIPMAHGVDSLNVAAASAVAFWEMRRR